jgi:ABC-type glycerol-3-phosphate transport system substrate-binding protein
MLLAACGSGGTGTSETDPAAEQVAVPQSTVAEGAAYASDVSILQFAVTRQDRNQYDSLIDAFEAEHGDVHIVTVSIEDTLGVNRPGAEWPDDAYLLLASAADVIAAPATRQAVQQGALLELSHFFESDPNLNADAFYPNVIDSVQWDGGIWSVPVEATYPLIYFDKSKFDTAGLDYPQPGWTWDDLLAAAQALTIRDGDAVTQWGFVPTSFDPVTFVQAQAGPLLDPDTEPPTAKLDSAAVEDAVRWYTDLFLTHGVAPYAPSSGEMGPGGFGGDTGMRLVMDGQAAMWFGTAFGGRMFGRGQQQEATGIVPLPVSSADDHSTPVEVDALSVSAGTQKADLAWEWVSFLAQQQARLGGNFGPMAMMMTTSVPAQPSVAAAAGVWDNLDEDMAAALTFAIEHAYVDTYDGAGYDTFNDAVVDIIENGTAVETALQGAQATVEVEIEEEVAAAPTPVADLVVSEEIDEAMNAGATMITFGTAGGGGMGGRGGRFGQQSLTTLVDEFQAAHPDILVELEMPQGFRGGLDMATMAAEYDCFQAAPSMSEEALAAVLSMEPFLSADPDVNKEDFYAGVLDQFVYQGQIWGLPGSATVNLVNYNKDLFDAAGLDYPALDWTTSDLLQAAVALTQDGDPPQYGYVPSQQTVNDLINLMDRLGVDLFDDSQDPPTLVLDSPEAEQVMRWYTGLTTDYEVTPDLEEISGGGRGGGARQTLINQGQVAMWTDGGMGQGPGGFGQQTQLNSGVVPLPAGANSDQGSGFQSVDGYFISSQTQARQACWEWITFLTEQPSAATGLPARQATAESDEYRQQVGDERAEAYLASISVGERASFFQRMSDEGNWLMFASMWLSNAYDSIVEGEMTVEEALADAQTKVDEYRNCVIANDAIGDMEALRSCMQEVGGTMGGPP